MFPRSPPGPFSLELRTGKVFCVPFFFFLLMCTQAGEGERRGGTASFPGGPSSHECILQGGTPAFPGRQPRLLPSAHHGQKVYEERTNDLFEGTLVPCSLEHKGVSDI